MKLITILAFLLLPLLVFPQQQEEDDGEDEYEEFHLNEIDSLRHLIKSCTDDSLLKNYYSGIAELTQICDTILKYGYLALSLCTENDYSLLGQNNYLIGMAYHNIGEDGTALPIVRKSLVYFKKANYLKGIAKDFQLMSYIYDDSNDLDSALSREAGRAVRRRRKGRPRRRRRRAAASGRKAAGTTAAGMAAADQTTANPLKVN